VIRGPKTFCNISLLILSNAKFSISPIILNKLLALAHFHHAQTVKSNIFHDAAQSKSIIRKFSEFETDQTTFKLESLRHVIPKIFPSEAVMDYTALQLQDLST
jgi:uncharacterized protein YqfB (UPF0267 family)